MPPHAATIIIPNYNGARFFSRLMESLHAPKDTSPRILVVDDASSDDCVAYLRSNWPQVRVIVNERNLGFAGTCNVGMRAATTPFVVLLNNDTHVDPNWLAEGLKPFEDPAVGAVASLTLLAEPPHLVDTAGDAYSVAGGAVKRAHLKPQAVGAAQPVQAFSASGVSAFYRREAVAAAGYLDERFESYYEDVDLGFRLARLGYKCAFAPRSICYHHLSSSYSPRSWRYHFNSARNAEVVWWANMPRRWKYLPAHLAFSFLQMGHKLWQGVGPAYLAGKLAALGRIGEIMRKRSRIRELAGGSDELIESALVRDWWGLHVRSRSAGGDA